MLNTSPMSATLISQQQQQDFDDNNNNIPWTIAAINQNSSTSSTSNANTTTTHNNNNNNNKILLPEILESLQKSDTFPTHRHRWNTNEEIAALLISLDRHEKWLSEEVQLRPKSGSMLLYSRKHVRYRRDGYCWKKRKDGKTTREDHMKLKVQGIECIYGCYVHSAILPTFHRRCYWLLQNPDIVLVHYLNVPNNDDNKMAISPSLNSLLDTRKEWTREDLILELKPMFSSTSNTNNNDNNKNNNNENVGGNFGDELGKSTLETIETIVQQLLIKQKSRLKALEENCNSTVFNHYHNAATSVCSNIQQHQQQKNDLNNNGLLSIRTILSSTSKSSLSSSSSSSITSNSKLQSNQQQSNCTTGTTKKLSHHQIYTSLSSGQILETVSTTKKRENKHHHQQQQPHDIDVNGNTIIINNNNGSSNTNGTQIAPNSTNTVQLVQLTSANGTTTMCHLNDPTNHHHHHQQQQQRGSIGSGPGTVSFQTDRASPASSPTSLILNMSQIQSSFIILNDNGNDPSGSNNQNQMTASTRNLSSDQSNTNSINGQPITFFTYRRTDNGKNCANLSSPSSPSPSPVLGSSSVHAFKVPVNVVGNGIMESIDNNSRLFSSSTETKNSVMTPIITTSGCCSLLLDKNNVHEAIIKTEDDQEEDTNITMSVNEIEMDTNGLDMAANDLQGQPFSLDDEESMLICNSNASTPERIINRHHQNLNLATISSNSYNHRHSLSPSSSLSKTLNKIDENHAFDDTSCFDTLSVDDHLASLMNSPTNQFSRNSNPVHLYSNIDQQQHLNLNLLNQSIKIQQQNNRQNQGASSNSNSSSLRHPAVVSNDASSKGNNGDCLMSISSHHGVVAFDHNDNDADHGIDFMDHEDIPTSDEILFNLETFDMFGEFDNLDNENDDTENGLSTSQTNHSSNQVNDNAIPNPNGNENPKNPKRPLPIHPSLLDSTYGNTGQSSSLSSSLANETINDVIDEDNIPTSVQEFWTSTTDHSSVTMNKTTSDSNFKSRNLKNLPTTLTSVIQKTGSNDNDSVSGSVSRHQQYHLQENHIIKTDGVGSLTTTKTTTTTTITKETIDSNATIGSTTSTIDVTVDENGNLSITRRASGLATSDTANTRFEPGGSLIQQQKNISTMSQNHPLLKRQLSNASLLLMKNHNDNGSNNATIINNNENFRQPSINNNNKQNNDNNNNNNRNNRIFYSSLSLEGRFENFDSRQNDIIKDIDHNGNDNNSLSSSVSNITITDYSPEWCYTEGGIKVLVAGPWFANVDTSSFTNNSGGSSGQQQQQQQTITSTIMTKTSQNNNKNTHKYSILFDNIPVPTELVQNGLLRCFSPKHDPGLVTLQVSCNDVIISNSVVFEYRSYSTTTVANNTNENKKNTTIDNNNMDGTFFPGSQ